MTESCRGKKALVVDNNKVILRLLTRMLQKKGYEVESAEDGLSALKVLKSFKPDIIFIDLIMPKINGEKLCRIIRLRPEFDTVFIVIISAVAAEEKIDFIGLGADACIAKGPAKEMEGHVFKVLALVEKKDTETLPKTIFGANTIYEREITKELLAMKQHFEITLENMADGFIELTPTARIIYANAAATRLFRKSEETLLSTLFFEHFDHKTGVYIKKSFERRADAAVAIGEKRSIVLHGKHILLKFVPVPDQEQKSVIVLLNDITKHKQAEEALVRHKQELEKTVAKRTRQLEEINACLEDEIAERKRTQQEVEHANRQWSKTFDTISDFVSVHDKDFKFTKVNRSLADFVGKKPAELLGRYCYEILHGTDSPWPDCPHVEAIRKRRTVTAELQDPESGKPLLVTCSPYFDEHGRVSGTVHITRDISDQKLAEAEREELIAELQSSLAQVRRLSGLLPICASCKKIRDDKGYWKQIESYIRDHSEAEFSHSICPDCVKKIYPDLFDKE